MTLKVNDIVLVEIKPSPPLTTLSERFAELPVMTVPGPLGEPRRVLDADVALDFARCEIASLVDALRSGRPNERREAPLPPDRTGDFEIGLEVYRAIQSAPRAVNIVIAMGTLARTAGLHQYQAERAAWEAERQQLLAAAMKKPRRKHKRSAVKKARATT